MRADIIIVGAGAAGLFAALAAAREGASVTILEKMERAGRKVRITGKGRCNITNTKPWQEFSTHIHPSSNFLRHSFYNLSNIDTIALLNEIGLKTVVERGDRVFPESGVAGDVAEVLLKELDRLNVKIIYLARVKEILKAGEAISGVIYEKEGTDHKIDCSSLIIATGGLSYPATGSDGDGYRFAKQLGHTLVDCFPSLTALMPVGYAKELEGLHLKNVEIALSVNNDIVQREFGELDFTNNGVEGSIGFKISRRAVKAMRSGSKCVVYIDLKPALTQEQLILRLEREIILEKEISKVFHRLLPKQLAQYFVNSYVMNGKSLVASSLNKKDLVGTNRKNVNTKGVYDLRNVVLLLKLWRMDIASYTSYERAVITAGGVSLDEIISKSMRSKLFNNLYFAGEVLNLDGDTGGYNLQIAFSTGYMAGQSAAGMVIGAMSMSEK